MSSLGPDCTLLDARPTSRVPASPLTTSEAATDISAAPLWTAFRDHYTRAKKPRHLDEAGEGSSRGLLGDIGQIAVTALRCD